MSTKQIIIVTGANVGIGKLTTLKLVQLGYHVIMGCRNEQSAQEAIKDISTTLNKDISDTCEFIKLDLGSFESIREFVSEFKKKKLPLHALINNAGVAIDGSNLTKEGFQACFGVNHIGHFLLTDLLLDTLKQSAPSRIVVVASNVHRPGVPQHTVGPNFTFDLEEMKKQDMMMAYKNSKLANVWYTYELARRLEGTGVFVNTMCPGYNPDTQLSRGIPPEIKEKLLKTDQKLIDEQYKTMDQQADAEIFLATSSEVKDSGKYYWDKIPVQSSDESYNIEKQKQLWELSVKLTGVGH
eukprot:TRINITY_DN11400_c0_g1_i1.p1 TRINITY_DN11400_c0_g1~~TRINITY_DN11400_c0_g1_i1.p1  ORF type:complete len:297 (+),score=61.68 TRINITY_DN11400_c0_g1_i1:302-1192(+)